MASVTKSLAAKRMDRFEGVSQLALSGKSGWIHLRIEGTVTMQ